MRYLYPVPHFSEVDRMVPFAAYRKCHVCNHVTVAGEAVSRCAGCEKPFAPFFYYDDRLASVVDASTPRPGAPEVGQWAPIRGLTAYWSPNE